MNTTRTATNIADTSNLVFYAHYGYIKAIADTRAIILIMTVNTTRTSTNMAGTRTMIIITVMTVNTPNRNQPKTLT